MICNRDVVKLRLFSVSFLTFFFVATSPQKLLAENSINTTNLTEKSNDLILTPSTNVTDNQEYISSQDFKIETKATLSAQAVNKSDLAQIELERLHNSTFNNTNEFESTFNTNSQALEVSRSAADLLAENTLKKQLLTSEVDLDTLCRTFPLNSRCAGYQQPSEQQRQRSLQRLSQPESERQKLESRLLERLALIPEAPARSGFALGGKVSTLGVGIEGVGAISPNFNGRLGFNYFGFSGGFVQNEIDYDGDLQLLNATGMLDWFPSSRSGFRVTGGLLYQNNRVDAIARSTEVLEVGGFEFPLAAVGQLEGSLTFPNTIAPYIGIGYGNPVRRGSAFSFNIDLGVLFPGSPQADLQATGPGVDIITGIPVLNNLLEEAIAQEEQQIEDNLSWLGVYPVLSIGVSYQF